MSQNPFETSHIPGDLAEDVTRPDGEVLAERGTRLGAAIIDGILVMCITLPVQLATGYLQITAAQQTPPLWMELCVNLSGVAAMMLLHGWMLTTRGQSIGKRLLEIQIVDYRDNGLLPFTRVLITRSFWLMPLALVAIFLPVNAKMIISVVVGLASFVDSLLIFGQARRCFHDTLAGSIVVRYRPDRSRSTF
ncbi:MAG: RDD family protein [Planctomycetota bacterium]